MTEYAIYTTEGVPLHKEGNVVNPGLVSFIDKYGVWVLYAPAVIGGRELCYIGARFDNVKETAFGRLNRVVLLVAIEKPKELQNAWKFFKRESIVKLAEKSGLIFDTELKTSDCIRESSPIRDEVGKTITEWVNYFLKRLKGTREIRNVHPEVVSIEGFTDVPYPSLEHRQYFMAAVAFAMENFISESCVPEVIREPLRRAYEIEGDLAYPLIVYSKANVPSLGGLWFSRG